MWREDNLAEILLLGETCFVYLSSFWVTAVKMVWTLTPIFTTSETSELLPFTNHYRLSLHSIIAVPMVVSSLLIKALASFRFWPTVAFFGNAGSKTAQLRQRDLRDRRVDPGSPGGTGRNFVRRCFRFVGGSNLQQVINLLVKTYLWMNHLISFKKINLNMDYWIEMIEVA